MKILVTGANGFIGQHLVTALEKRGDSVVKLPHAELENPMNLYNLFALKHRDVDYVFHLAAYGNMAHQKAEDNIFMANLWGVYNLLQATKHLPYKALVNVSSSAVLLPHQTMYSATKLGGEALCKAFVDEYGKPIVSVRPFTIYGPGEADFRFIPTVFRSCLTGEKMQLVPDSVHDFVYVDDFVNYLLHAAKEAEELAGTSINVGTGKGITNREIVTLIEAITKRKSVCEEVTSLRSYDSPEWVSARMVFPEPTPLEDGLEKCYAYYKKRYDK